MKESYETPMLTVQDLLRDITAGASGRTLAGPRALAFDRLPIIMDRLPRL